MIFSIKKLLERKYSCTFVTKLKNMRIIAVHHHHYIPDENPR